MSNSLEFGIETTGERAEIVIAGPSTALRKAGRKRPKVQVADGHKIFQYAETKPGTSARDRTGEVRLNLRKAGGILNKQERRSALEGVLDYLYFLGSGQADHIDPDPRLVVSGGVVNLANPDELIAKAKTPDLSDPEALRRAALSGMKVVARDLGYGGRPGTPIKDVERNLSRSLDASFGEEGIVFSADSANGASISTSDDFNPEAGLTGLYARDLSNPAQRVICLAGVISMVQADAVA